MGRGVEAAALLAVVADGEGDSVGFVVGARHASEVLGSPLLRPPVLDSKPVVSGFSKVAPDAGHVLGLTRASRADAFSEPSSGLRRTPRQRYQTGAYCRLPWEHHERLVFMGRR